MSDLREAAQQALEALESVLCDPEGKCCIDGSDADRAVVDKALAAFRAAAPELLEALQEVVAFTGAHGGPYVRARAAIAKATGEAT